MSSIHEHNWGLKSVQRGLEEKNRRDLASRQYAYLREGQPPPSTRLRMVAIRDGVAEVSGDWAEFVAALNTNEGQTILRGGKTLGDDIQSGPSSEWRSAIEALDEAIRSAYDKRRPVEALAEIALIWEQLDRTSELAAARSRILLGKVGEPELADLPEWFQEQESGLFEHEEDEIAPHPAVVQSARLLVQAVSARTAEMGDFKAELETGPMGRVILDWHVPELRLQWMVEAVDLPWPSAKVYELSRCMKEGSSAAAQTRILYNAFDVVESFVAIIQGK